MDYGNPLGIRNRVVSDTEHKGQPARVVGGSRIFSTSVEGLWDALTNEERIPLWLLPVTGDLKLGGRYQLEGHAGGEISRCVPPKALDVTWECGGNVSWLTVRVEPEGDDARLTLEHIMWKDEASEEHWNQYGPGATGVGWDLGFLGLGLHLDNEGAAVDREECNEWMVTDDGKAFIRLCAKSWGEVHVASGENETVATEMAEQTAKAYLGE